MSAAGIGIICKAPRAGESKTRLVPLLGPQGAAQLAGCLLQDVAAAISLIPEAIGWKGYGIYASQGSESVLQSLLPETFDLLLRNDTDFGRMLFGAVEALLAKGHDCVLLVNADSPTLPPLLIASAIAALRLPGDRLVLGPAVDGGYTVIGLKQAHRRLFEDIDWSTPSVMPQTQERASELGLAVNLLPEWYDVDDVATFALLLDELAGEAPPFATPGLIGAPAVATRTFVSEHSRWPGNARVPSSGTPRTAPL